MELKAYRSSPMIPPDGIESGIHSMELKEKPWEVKDIMESEVMNPFNGIERNMKLPNLGLGASGTRIHSMELKVDCYTSVFKRPSF